MGSLSKSAAHLLLPGALLAASALSAISGLGARTTPLAEPPGGVQQIRSFASSEHGVPKPDGIAWSEELGSLVLAQSTGGRTRLRAVMPEETDLGAATVRLATTAGGLAVQGSSGAVTMVADGQVWSVPSKRLRSFGSRLEPRLLGSVANGGVQGATYDDTGRLVLLRAGLLVRMGSSGSDPERTVGGRAGHELRGLAARPETRDLFTYDATTEQVVATRGGLVTATYDASDLELADVRGLTFGPSADTTDDPSVQSLYLLDSGGPGNTGEVVEAALNDTAIVNVADIEPTAVRTVDTSVYDPPSPDPSGVAYLPSADRLFIADGEVDEMSIFEGSNLFVTTRAGAVSTTGVSQPWSDEPVGVGYNPTNNHLFVSDDDQKEVFELVAGPDGRFGTSDDTVTHFDTAGFGNTDPEGLDYDPVTNSVWLVDGVNTDVFRVQAGSDGRVGTSDDVRTRFDVGIYGARDPEGLGYDSVRDTIVIVDDSSDKIYELDKAGALLNRINTSSAGMTAAAGITVAPSTSGSARGYYVVARGEDNDSHPTENDGRLYEISASLPPLGGGPVNLAPVVEAGTDASVTLPLSASLDGTVTDDGLPDPPGAVTTTWSEVSGPGTVTFGDAAAVDTTASFSEAGTYVLRLTADDGAATVADEVTIQVSPVGGASIVEVRVVTGSDDAEQTTSGFVGLTSNDLELTTDGSTQQVVGVRFAGLQVPAGATITSAYVQFRTDEVSTGASSMVIRAESADNTSTYQAVSGNVTSRATTSASVAWSPPDWNTVGEAAAAQRTPDVSALVQAVVGRAGWAQGNALALQFSGTGRRTAEAFEGGASLAPLLHVEYTTGSGGGGGGPVNQAPVVDAGTDANVALPSSASLDGTVTDDGLPDPPGAVTTTWSEVSGPGTVTFGDAAAVDTTASFSEAGSYVLRLTATDGELTSSDQVTLTVAAAGSGGAQTLEVRVGTGSDDAEQSLRSGKSHLTSNDLELTTDGNTQQVVGVRFAGLQVPAGATITSAYVQFRTDEVSTGASSMVIRAESADNTSTYQAVSGNVTSRATTSASVAWSPPDWNTVGEAAAAQRTPDVSALVQAVVGRAGWAQGNALALQFSGTGRRTAEAFEGGASLAPLLHVEYTTG